MGNIARAVDQHLVGMAIQEAFQPEGHFYQRGVFQDPDGNGKSWPQVTHFEQKWNMLQARQKPGGNTLKDGR